MCGRFTLAAPTEVLKGFFPLFDLPDVQPRYNIAPTQPVIALRHLPGAAQPEFVYLRWGLIPAWADDIKVGSRMINARCETVADKPAFRNAFRQRRCLILADGFYEWQKIDGRKQPYYIHLRDRKPFAFAGLWEIWNKQGERVESCTILTTDANEMMRPLHDRMPVILSQDAFASWLDPAQHDGTRLQPLLRPFPSELLTSEAVSTCINNARYDERVCVMPLGGI